MKQMGDTIMHYAAYNSLKKLLEYLLDKGCDPNCCNNVIICLFREDFLQSMWPYPKSVNG